MLSRDLRLSAVSIPQLLRRGMRVHTETIDFLFQKHPSEKRFACIVSAKVEKLAVGRNRTKRLVAHALYALIPSMTGGVHGVVVVRRKLSLDQTEVTALLTVILQTAHIVPS